ncbi:MAG: alpha-1,6-mannosyltransferase [Oceanospirillaceae bacterium]|jgi:alpha-1,6-mannosyltransferase
MVRQRFHLVVLLLMLVLHGAMAFWVEREQTVLLLASFAGLNLFWFLTWFDLKITVKQVLVLGLLMRAVYLFHLPSLSDDVYRYLWDGKLLLDGISPFQFTPKEWLVQQPLFDAEGLYPLLNSKEYYSVYPPFQQVIYAFVNLIAGHSILLKLITLRLLVILAEFGSMILILKLLKHYERSATELMLYALNPLIIIEFTGNLHGEVFMVFFMLLFLWLWAKDGLILAASAFGLAVLSKLLPLMFLPAIILKLKWSRGLLFGCIVGSIALAGFIPMANVDQLIHMNASLQKYFLSFEFNGSIYYLIREFGFWWKGYNIIYLTGKVVPFIVLGLILALSVLKRKQWNLPAIFMFAWMIYYLFATTVNPWYIAVLIPFSIFSKYRSAFLWSLLVPLSYHAFRGGGVQENTWVLWMEYLPVYVWLIYEMGLLNPLLRWYTKRKADVKWNRLNGIFQKGETVVDLGCGNGALSLKMDQSGINIIPVDVDDKSLFKSVKPTIYDGSDLSSAVTSKVDAIQMITMLHHVDDPEKLISQAFDLTNKLVVMEDVCKTPWQELITHVTDSIVNLEFIGHPHTNKTDTEWKALFSKYGFELKEFKSERFLIFFRQNTYVLKKRKSK